MRGFEPRRLASRFSLSTFGISRTSDLAPSLLTFDMARCASPICPKLPCRLSLEVLLRIVESEKCDLAKWPHLGLCL
jgi:hypothetical protein